MHGHKRDSALDDCDNNELKLGRVVAIRLPETLDSHGGNLLALNTRYTDVLFGSVFVSLLGHANDSELADSDEDDYLLKRYWTSHHPLHPLTSDLQVCSPNDIRPVSETCILLIGNELAASDKDNDCLWASVASFDY